MLCVVEQLKGSLSGKDIDKIKKKSDAEQKNQQQKRDRWVPFHSIQQKPDAKQGSKTEAER